jgi:hypothetical protein
LDRKIVYPGQIPLETDLLGTNQNAMIGLGKLAAAIFGTAGTVNGLTVGPNTPAALNVVVSPGEIYQLQNLEATAYSSLPADTTHTVVKQGILLDPAVLACPAPTTAGFSINYLIEATYVDADNGPTVLPYYNASNPSQAYNGPNGTGTAQATNRAGQVQLQVKAGIAAATGSQVTPAVDAGYIALAVVTVANGQATVVAGNIVAASDGLRITQPVTTGRLLNIQVITASGVYTPTAGTKSVQVEVIGGGGAGGGVSAAAAGQAASGGGGGSGARGISTRISTGFSGVAITVGAGGVGVTGGAGGAGGTSSFGSFVSAPGGGGASLQTSQAGPGFGQQGFGAVFPTGSAVLVSAPGWSAKPGIVYSSAVTFTGQGADTVYAQGGNASGSSATNQRGDGNNANGYGAGGGGGYATAGAAAAKGGNGAAGVVIVYEFS